MKTMQYGYMCSDMQDIDLPQINIKQSNAADLQ